MTFDLNEKMYTTSKIADMFGVKPATVRQWIRDGKLKSVEVNGYHKVRESDLKAFAEERYG